MQRSTKIQEFVAHGSAVNCLHIGRKSGSVLVTGGEDKKVNVWAIGKTNAIMSLAGHTSSVECVSFDSNEQTVIAGSAGGTLKLWDLEHAKVARTLTGHRSNCISVQWHPYGEFFASGSVDTNLKIWDIRRKSCIQTYKGHSKGVRQIAFSPDGRWVVSGGDDGAVKLWDLTMGKLVHEFTQHAAPVNALAVHPSEFLMASASADRMVRLWDLESFEQVSCTPPDSGQVRRMAFSDDGSVVFSGAEESLKVWGWEPVRCHEQVNLRWNRLADLCLAPGNKILAGSIREAMVGVWSLDASALIPETARQHADDNEAAPVSPVAVRISSDTPKLHHGRAGPHQHSSTMSFAKPAEADAVAAVQNARDAIAACRAQMSAARRSTTTADQPDPGRRPPISQNSPSPGTYTHASPGRQQPAELSSSGKHASVGTSTSATLTYAVNYPSCADQCTCGSADDIAIAPVTSAGQRDLDDALIARLHNDRSKLRLSLSPRLAQLRALHSYWHAGDVKQVGKMLIQLKRLDDPTIVADLLRAGIVRGGRLDLECALHLLPLLKPLLESGLDAQKTTAIDAIAELVLIFGPLIRDTRAMPTVQLGVDLSAEARQQRCQAAHELFLNIVPLVRQLSAADGAIGRQASELLPKLIAQLKIE